MAAFTPTRGIEPRHVEPDGSKHQRRWSIWPYVYVRSS